MRGTLCIGIANGLLRRVEQHRDGTGSAVARKCKAHMLVWFRAFADVGEAIQREKTMKEWPRQWQINLIEADNPHWVELFPVLPGVRAVHFS